MTAGRFRSVVGVVLAGGLSRRMGEDKAGLILAGATLAELAAERLAAVCAEVVAADRGRGTVPGVRSVSDGPGRGPAAGLLGAARAYPGQPLLVLAVDLPGVPAELLAALAARVVEPPEGAPAADCAVPRSRQDREPRSGGGLEPLVACYGPRALAALGERVAAGHLAPRGLFEREDLAVAVIEGPELERFGDPERMLMNVNTPADLARFRLGQGEDPLA